MTMEVCSGKTETEITKTNNMQLKLILDFFLLHTFYFLLPTSYCPLPTAHCRLLTADC